MPHLSTDPGSKREQERQFPPEPGSAPAARQFVLGVGWSEDVELNNRLSTVVSEVVTNAILHARTPFVVRVTPGEKALRVAVSDRSSVFPSKRSYDSLQPTGRGIQIIEAIADRWGVTPDPSGKTVWFEFARGKAAR